MPETEKKNPSSKPKKTQTQLLISDMLWLLVKIAFIFAVLVFLFTFLFGIYRNTDPSMIPAIKDGDLILYYRLDKRYSANDVLITELSGKKVALRVTAVAGDEVDIRDGELYINGFMQTEYGIYTATERFEDGPEFPMAVPENAVFVLGDNRYNATDSRIFGPVDVEDTEGKVISLIRRRGI